MTPEQYKKDLLKQIAEKTEQLAMLQYQNKIKGMLILVIDNNDVLRLMEAYGADTGLVMNTAIDIAKTNCINGIIKHMTNAERE